MTTPDGRSMSTWLATRSRCAQCTPLTARRLSRAHQGNLHGGSGRAGPEFGPFRDIVEPDDTLEVMFKVDYSHLEFGGNAVTSFGFDLFHPTNQDANFKYEDKSIRGVLKVKYDFDNGITLTSLTAHNTSRPRTISTRTDQPGIAFFDSTGDINIYSQELDMISSDDATVRWVSARSASDNRSRSALAGSRIYVLRVCLGSGIGFPALTSPRWDRQQTDYAGFAHMGYNLTSSV